MSGVTNVLVREATDEKLSDVADTKQNTVIAHV